MKVVISSFGSSGDFNPCLGLARTLQQKGVDVIFLSNPYYQKKITDAGLRFSPSGEYMDVFKEISSNPDYLHPRKGPKALWKFLLRNIPVLYGSMKQLIKDESPDIVALHALEFGGMIAAIESQTPYVTITPTPMGWFNPQVASHATYAHLPFWLRKLICRFAVTITDLVIKKSLNPHCQKNGIPPELNSIHDVFGKASMNLGLWSPLIRDVTQYDPPNSQICGFVRDEHIKDWLDVPADIVEIFKSDPKPVVVALGSTACLHGGTIYSAAADACKNLNLPCLLVGPNLQKYADLSRKILSVDFAPFGWVFPRASLIVHHGGVNSTGEAMRAGVPFVVVPHAYDQFDNSIRTQKMGISERIKVSAVNSDSLTEMFMRVQNNTRMQQTAKQVSQEILQEPDGSQVAYEALLGHFKIA